MTFVELWVLKCVPDDDALDQIRRTLQDVFQVGLHIDRVSNVDFSGTYELVVSRSATATTATAAAGLLPSNTTPTHASRVSHTVLHRGQDVMAVRTQRQNVQAIAFPADATRLRETRWETVVALGSGGVEVALERVLTTRLRRGGVDVGGDDGAMCRRITLRFPVPQPPIPPRRASKRSKYNSTSTSSDGLEQHRRRCPPVTSAGEGGWHETVSTALSALEVVLRAIPVDTRPICT